MTHVEASMWRHAILFSAVVTLVLGYALCCQAAGYRWPEIAPLHRTFYFPDATKAAAQVVVDGTDGKPLYSLECRTGDSEVGNFLWSGDFDCYLASSAPETNYEDLLHDDLYEGTEWWSRGRMLADQLRGQCANYPEYGTLRHFRLRGMELSFKFDRLSFARTNTKATFADKTIGAFRAQSKIQTPQGLVILKSFGFEVQANPDPTALSAIAEPITGTADRARCKELIPPPTYGKITKKELEEDGLTGTFPVVRRAAWTFLLHGLGARFQYSSDSGKTWQDSFGVDIVDSHGQKAYRFECSQYPGGWENYFIINCGLFAPGSKINLLADTIDPYSLRALNIVMPAQLYGQCAHYPEWGVRREFRLRHMKVTMLFRKLVFSAKFEPDGSNFIGGLESGEVQVLVEPDRTVNAVIASPPKYIYWGFMARPNPCAVPLRVDP